MSVSVIVESEIIKKLIISRIYSYCSKHYTAYFIDLYPKVVFRLHEFYSHILNSISKIIANFEGHVKKLAFPFVSTTDHYSNKN